MGVDAVGPQGPISLTADRIVLCAGAIQSAHLLMLSGVGDEAMLRAAGVPVVAPLPVGMFCSDHPEWVLPTNWTVATGRPVLEVVLSTDDGHRDQAVYGRFRRDDFGDGTAGHPDWPHIGVALMQPRARGRITLVSPDPACRRASSTVTTASPKTSLALRRGSELARELASAATYVGAPVWATSQHLCGSAPMGVDG